MPDPINILCCTDSNYAPYYGIMLTSLLENNRGPLIHVYIMTAGLSPSETELFDKLSDRYNVKIFYQIIDEDRLKDCPVRVGDHVSLATYFRLLAPVLLPENVTKLLYLDGDIIVSDSISELWEQDLTGFALGAVTDESYYLDAPYERLSYPKADGYINAGVLQMNLDYWRTHQVTQRLMDCIDRQADILTFHDQDAINLVLHKEIKRLPARYNLQNGFLQDLHFQHFTEELKEDVAQAVRRPCIIHFGGKGKPWHRREQHPFLSYFQHYKKISLWRSLPQSGRKSLYLDFHFALRKIKQSLGILPKPYNIPPRKWNR